MCSVHQRVNCCPRRKVGLAMVVVLLGIACSPTNGGQSDTATPGSPLPESPLAAALLQVTDPPELAEPLDLTDPSEPAESQSSYSSQGFDVTFPDGWSYRFVPGFAVPEIDFAKVTVDSPPGFATIQMTGSIPDTSSWAITGNTPGRNPPERNPPIRFVFPLDPAREEYGFSETNRVLRGPQHTNQPISYCEFGSSTLSCRDVLPADSGSFVLTSNDNDEALIDDLLDSLQKSSLPRIVVFLNPTGCSVAYDPDGQVTTLEQDSCVVSGLVSLGPLGVSLSERLSAHHSEAVRLGGPSVDLPCPIPGFEAIVGRVMDHPGSVASEPGPVSITYSVAPDDSFMTCSQHHVLVSVSVPFALTLEEVEADLAARELGYVSERVDLGARFPMSQTLLTSHPNRGSRVDWVGDGLRIAFSADTVRATDEAEQMTRELFAAVFDDIEEGM